MHTPPSRRTYDHRIREAICRTRNPHLFPDVRIPRSTTASWLRRGYPRVVSCDPPRDDIVVLRERIARLEMRIQRLAAVIGVQRALLRVADCSLAHTRGPAGAAKATVLQAVGRARRTLPLGAILRVLQLSPAR